MDTEQTIQELANRLQYAVDMLERNPIQPLKQWKADTDWLLYAVRNRPLKAQDQFDENIRKTKRVSDILSDFDWHIRDLQDAVADLKDELE